MSKAFFSETDDAPCPCGRDHDKPLDLDWVANLYESLDAQAKAFVHEGAVPSREFVMDLIKLSTTVPLLLFCASALKAYEGRMTAAANRRARGEIVDDEAHAEVQDAITVARLAAAQVSAPPNKIYLSKELSAAIDAMGIQ